MRSRQRGIPGNSSTAGGNSTAVSQGTPPSDQREVSGEEVRSRHGPAALRDPSWAGGGTPMKVIGQAQTQVAPRGSRGRLFGPAHVLHEVFCHLCPLSSVLLRFAFLGTRSPEHLVTILRM